VNRRTVVVMHVVGPVIMPWIDHPNVSAVVLAGIPGQESGNSLADVLFGSVNPSGKLVYTIANNRADYPADVIYDATDLPVTYSEKLLIDYRWFDAQSITPAFHFGFGLSYTTFSYTNINTTAGTDTNTLLKVTADITNTGNYAGEEVVQLYLGFPASAGEPPKILRGFDKVFVGVGQTVQASFVLNQIDMSIFDATTQTWLVPSGSFQIMIGSSSAPSDIHLTATVTPPIIPTTTTSGSTTSGTTTAITLSPNLMITLLLALLLVCTHYF